MLSRERMQEQQLARMEAGGGCFPLPLHGHQQPAVSFAKSFCAGRFENRPSRRV